MKKKLSLQDIAVKSFVTQVATHPIKGGAKTLVNQCSVVFCSQVDACITARQCTQ